MNTSLRWGLRLSRAHARRTTSLTQASVTITRSTSYFTIHVRLLTLSYRRVALW